MNSCIFFKMENRKCHTGDITEKRFRDLLYLFRFGGIPLYMTKISRTRSVYSAIISFCLYFMYVAEWLEVYNSNELKSIMKSLRSVVPITTLVFVELIFRFRVGAFNELLKMTELFSWEDMAQRHPETGNITIAGWIPRIRIFMRRIIIFFMSFHLTQRAVTAVTEHELMYASWYPFDTTSSPQFEIVYLTQILATFVLITTFLGFIYLYSTLIIIACSQLDYLKDSLLGIQHKRMSSKGEIKSCTQMQTEEQEKLNECIRHHQNIVRFLQALEEAMNKPMCVILLILLIALCTVAFSIITSWGDVIDMVQGVVTYLSMMMLVFAYCVLGTLLTERYESVRDAAWASDWVGMPVSYQRCILFIIAKSNQEFILTAGKFVPVSNATMMNMLNQSLSLFMFLLTMKDKNEGLVK